MSKLRMEKKSPLCVETISVAITSAFSFSVWTCITWILLLHLHSLSLHPLPTATCTLIHIDRNNIWFVVSRQCVSFYMCHSLHRKRDIYFEEILLLYEHE